MSGRHFGAAGALVCVAVYAALALAHGEQTAYFTVLNDFWGNAFAATHWKWSARQQWNGFYPPGYPTLLAVLPGRRLVESAYYLNVASGAALLTAVWMFGQRMSGAAVGLASLVAVAIHPVVLTQVLTTGPDAPFVALTAAGALALFGAVVAPVPSVRLAVVAGAGLGAAIWLRYHGLAWAGAVTLAALLVTRGRALRPAVAAGSVVAVAALGLAMVGLAAGDLSALQRDQAFNVYKGHVGPVNWFHLDAANLPLTVGEAIGRDPEAFWRSYVAYGRPHLWFAAACAVAAGLARGLARQFALFVLATGVIFIPWVNLGASPRGTASFIPLLLVAVTWAVADVLRRLDPRLVRTTVAAVTLAAGAAFAWRAWVPEIGRYADEARARLSVSQELERLLRADRVKLGTQVFSVADFYLVNAPGWHVGNYFPRITGGWPSLDLPEYRETYPPPATSSLDAFLDDCQRLGVSHLVLSGAAGQVSRELGQVFDGRLTTDRVAEVGGVPGVRVFRIVR